MTKHEDKRLKWFERSTNVTYSLFIRRDQSHTRRPSALRYIHETWRQG